MNLCTLFQQVYALLALVMRRRFGFADADALKSVPTGVE